MLKNPRQGQRAHRRVPGASGVREIRQSSKHAFARQVQIRLGAQRHPRTFGVRRAGLILSSQPSARERAEGGKADALVAAERKHLALRRAIEQAV